MRKEEARRDSKLLEGLKVLDLGVAGAGPIGPTLLAELGAEVIKIEMPEMGTLMRRIPPLYKDISLWKVVELRNKKSLAVDMHTADGQRLIKELIKEYDIIVENYRPGTLERWNLGYEELKQINQGVILVRVSGFGQDGPYKRRTSYDTVGAAMGGIIYLTGYPESSPVPLGLAYCDYISAAFNTLATLLAVHYRNKTGLGQWADIAQYEAIFRISEYNVAAYDRLGLVRERTGNRHPSIAPGDLFTTRDGRWVIIAASNDHHFAKLAQVIGRENLTIDPRFETIAKRAENADEINMMIEDWVKGKTLAELKETFDKELVPFSPILNIEDIFADPHYRARNNIIELDDPVMGKVKVPNVVPKFSLNPGLVRDTGPSLGEHNEEIMCKVKEMQEFRIEERTLGGNPELVEDEDQVLSGLRILDIGPGLAGPFGATLLADFGAEVLKIEKPREGDPLRHTPPFYNGTSLWWAVDGRNKKSITLDLKSGKGQEIFKKLVSISDVVIESFRPGTLEEWNLSYDELRKENERIILVRVSGFGQDGPYSHRPAIDAIGAAMGGFTYITGSPEYPPVKPSISIADYLAGVFTAISVMAALYYRDRAGKGQWVDLTLYEPFCRFSHENIPVYHKLGIIRERIGNLYSTTGLQILYQARDGKRVAILVAEDKDFARLARAMGRDELAQDPRYATLVKRIENRDNLNPIIAEWARGIPGRELVDILAKNQVPTSLVYSIKDIFEDPHYQSRGNIIEIDDPLLGKFRMQDVVPKLSLTPGGVKNAGPALGQHNQEIFLGLLGLNQEEIEILEEEKIV